jgi:pilus assembly protein TadC
MTTFMLEALAAALVLIGPRPRAATVRARLDTRSRTAISAPAVGKEQSEPVAHRANPTTLAWAGAGAVGISCVVAAGAPGALAAAVVVPTVAAILRRQIARTPAPTDTASRAALPLTCDLIAAGMRSGAAVPTALAATARTAPAGLGRELNRVAALLSLGTSAGEAWSALARDPVLGSVAVVAARSADSGIRLADALSRCARSERAELHAASVARAESVGVMALLPLGLCFLPAFICLGVVPVVAGIAADVFSRVAS